MPSAPDSPPRLVRGPLDADTLDYAILVIAYMVCADEQIHSEEVHVLTELAEKANASQGTMIQVHKVLGDTDDKVPLDTALDHVSPAARGEVLRLLSEIAWADGIIADAENAFLERCASRWRLALPAAPGRGLLTGPRASPAPVGNEQLSMGARVVSVLNQVLGPRIVDGVTQLAPDGISRRIVRAQSEVLLSGAGYDEAIDLCTRIAGEDFGTSERILRRTVAALEALREQMKLSLDRIAKVRRGGGQGHAKDAHDAINRIRCALDTEVMGRVQALQVSQSARRRALGYFTVAFMGRTKAGKSTLHAVVTGEGWDAVGAGKQRTTRFNRVYEWRRVRIVDTPGIGAPGGKTDEQIARSVIDEADVVCYVVTDDSQQASEFTFLHVLRDNLKPLVILLNVKQNLRSPERLARFLKNPDSAFRSEGTNGVRGHEQRIRRYAREHYGHDIFPVIPVQLLAAQMSREPEHREQSAALMEASRLPDFLDHLRVTVLRDGTLRRSHTLLGATALDLRRHGSWLERNLADLKSQGESIKTAQRRVETELTRSAQDAQTLLSAELGKRWAQLRTDTTPFAEDHWDWAPDDLQAAWAAHLTAQGFEGRLRDAFDAAARRYRTNVAAVLDEIGKELELTARFSTQKASFGERDRSMLGRNIMRFGGQLLAIAGGIAAFFTPWGWAAILVGTIASFLSGWFTSREEKRRKAVETITRSLREQLESQESKVTASAASALHKGTEETLAACQSHFAVLGEAVAAIQAAFSACLSGIVTDRDEASLHYGARILDWVEDAVGTRDQDRAVRDVAQCALTSERLELTPKRPLQTVRTADAVSQVLQIPIQLNGVQR